MARGQGDKDREELGKGGGMRPSAVNNKNKFKERYYLPHRYKLAGLLEALILILEITKFGVSQP